MVLARSMHSEPCRGYPSPRKKEALLACQLASGALFRLGIPLATTDHWCRENRRGEVNMHRTTASYLSAAVLVFAALLMAAPDPLPAQQTAQVAIDHDDIGGVVRSRSGPEAGVWVIAETTELPTKYAKMVVTDDKGRYVIPDLPTANYSVWVRGYGLVDSPKVRAKPGQQLNLTAVPAPDERAAAHYYPAIYWYTMMKIPPAKDFGGASDIPKNVTQELWRHRMNNTDCIGCHQLGPAPSDRQCLRAAVWLERVLERRHADPRSEDAQGDVLQDAGRGSGRAGIVRPALPCLRRCEADAALALLGRGEDLEPAGQQPQRHVRHEGPGVVRRGRARHRESRLLQEGFGPSLGQGVPARALGTPGVDARSEDDEVQLRRHVLRHASPAVRL